jgi:hypothetical protein
MTKKIPGTPLMGLAGQTSSACVKKISEKTVSEWEIRV